MGPGAGFSRAAPAVVVTNVGRGFSFMRVDFGSVCSGIEAASVAFSSFDWEAAWLAEIESFPSEALDYHYFGVPNHGDMTKLPALIRSDLVSAPSVFCGGTPCQAFSVAGARRSLSDHRGNLSLVFCDIADAIDETRTNNGDDECVIFWENVPGVLNTKDNAFGCFLAQLAGEEEPLVPAGKKWTNAGAVFGPKRAIAWRVLDAQYFGLAQRRRRVFVVASAREGFDPVAVLFEREGVRRDSPPSREAREADTGRTSGRPGSHGWPAEIAATLNASFGEKQGLEDQHINGGAACSSLPAISLCLNAGAMGRCDWESETLIHTTGVGFDVTHSLTGEGFDASEDGTGRGTPLVPTLAFHANAQPDQMRFDEHVSSSLTCSQNAAALTGKAVRRLTPRECERLQGFPDDYTAIPWKSKPASECPDGPRYKALGNSWPVPVVRWIGERIHKQLELCEALK